MSIHGQFTGIILAQIITDNSSQVEFFEGMEHVYWRYFNKFKGRVI
jgi:hypothetical protein